MLKNIDKNKIVVAIILFLVALAIPLTIIQVQKQQEIRQRAEGFPQPVEKVPELTGCPITNSDGTIDVQKTQQLCPPTPPPISLRLGPPSKNVLVNETFDIGVFLVNSTGKNIAAVDITMNYDRSVLTLVKFETTVPEAQFYAIINDQAKIILDDKGQPATGVIHYVGTNFNPNTEEVSPSTTSTLKIGTLTFEALKEGTARVTFDNDKIQIAASKNRTNVFDPANNSNRDGEYAIFHAFTVSGTIYNASQHGIVPFQPFRSGAYVTLTDQNNKSYRSEISDVNKGDSKNGGFEFKDVPAGNAKIRLHLPYGFSSTEEPFETAPTSRGLDTPVIFKDINVIDDTKVNFFLQTSYPVNAIVCDSYRPTYTTFTNCLGKNFKNNTKDWFGLNCQSVDLNKDDKIDSFDYILLMRNASNACTQKPATPTPPPTTPTIKNQQ